MAKKTRREKLAERIAKAEAEEAKALKQRRSPGVQAGQRRKPPRTPRTVSRARARVPKDWRAKFLDAMGKLGNVTAACEAAGISRSFAYSQKSKLPAFGRLWEAAEARAVEQAEMALYQRGVVGVERPVYGSLGADPQTGKSRGTGEVGSVTEYDTPALIAFLKAHRPEKYRERFEVKHDEKMSEVDEEILALTRELKQSAGAAPVPVE